MYSTKRWFLFTMSAIICNTVADAQSAVAFPTKFNILYIGIENPVRVMVDGSYCKDYTVSMTGAEITPIGNCMFNVFIPSLTVEEWRKAYILDKNKAIVDSLIFRIQAIPDPVMDRSTEFIRPMPLSATSFYSVFDTLQFEWHFTILDFEVVRQRGKEFSTTILNKTATFSPETLELLRSAKSRDAFHFESIRVKGADGYIRHLRSITLSCE